MDPSTYNHDAIPSLDSVSTPRVNPSPRRSLLGRLSTPIPTVKAPDDGSTGFRPLPPMPSISFETFQFSSLATKGVPSLLQRMFPPIHHSPHSPPDARANETPSQPHSSSMEEVPALHVLNQASRPSQSVYADARPPFFSSEAEGMAVDPPSPLLSMKTPSEISLSNGTVNPFPPETAPPHSKPQLSSLPYPPIPTDTTMEIHPPQWDTRTTVPSIPFLFPSTSMPPAVLPPIPMSTPARTFDNVLLQNFFAPSMTPSIASISRTESVDPVAPAPPPAPSQERAHSYLDILYAEVQQEQNEWRQVAELKKEKSDRSRGTGRQDTTVGRSGPSMVSPPHRGLSPNVVELSTTIAGLGGPSSPQITQLVQPMRTTVDTADHLTIALPSKVNVARSMEPIPSLTASSTRPATAQPLSESWRDESARSLRQHPTVPQWVRELNSVDTEHLTHATVQAVEDRYMLLPALSIHPNPISLKRKRASSFGGGIVVKTERSDEDDALPSQNKRVKRSPSPRPPSLKPTKSPGSPAYPHLGQPLPLSTPPSLGSFNVFFEGSASQLPNNNGPDFDTSTPPRRPSFPSSDDSKNIISPGPGSYSLSLQTAQQAHPARVHISPREVKTETGSLTDHKEQFDASEAAVQGPHNARSRPVLVLEPSEAPHLKHEGSLDGASSYLGRPRAEDLPERRDVRSPEQNQEPTSASPALLQGDVLRGNLQERGGELGVMATTSEHDIGDDLRRPASRTSDGDARRSDDLLTKDKPLVPHWSNAVSPHLLVESPFEGPSVAHVPHAAMRIESLFAQCLPPVDQQLHPISDDARILRAQDRPVPISRVSTPPPVKQELETDSQVQPLLPRGLSAEDITVPGQSTITAPSSTGLEARDPAFDSAQELGHSPLRGPAGGHEPASIEAPRAQENLIFPSVAEFPPTGSVDRILTDAQQPAPESPSEQWRSYSTKRTAEVSRNRVPPGGQSSGSFQGVYSSRSGRNHDAWIAEPSPQQYRPSPPSPRRNRSVSYAQRRSRSPSPRSRPQNRSPNQYPQRVASSNMPHYRNSVSPPRKAVHVLPASNRHYSPVWNEGPLLHPRQGEGYVSNIARGDSWRPPPAPSRAPSPVISPGGTRYEIISRSPTSPEGRPLRRRRSPNVVPQAGFRNHVEYAGVPKDSLPAASEPIPPVTIQEPSSSIRPVVKNVVPVGPVAPIPLSPRPPETSLVAPRGHLEAAKPSPKPSSKSSKVHTKQPWTVDHVPSPFMPASEHAVAPARATQHPGTNYQSVSPDFPARSKTLSSRISNPVELSVPPDSRSTEKVLFAEPLRRPISEDLTHVTSSKPSLLSRMNPKIEVSSPSVPQIDNYRGDRSGSSLSTYDAYPASSDSLLSRVGGSQPRRRENPLASLYDVRRGNHVQGERTDGLARSQTASTAFSDRVHQTSPRGGGASSRARGRSRGRGRGSAYDGV